MTEWVSPPFACHQDGEGVWEGDRVDLSDGTGELLAFTTLTDLVVYRVNDPSDSEATYRICQFTVEFDAVAADLDVYSIRVADTSFVWQFTKSHLDDENWTVPLSTRP